MKTRYRLYRLCGWTPLAACFMASRWTLTKKNAANGSEPKAA